MWPDATRRLLKANEEVTVGGHRGQLRSRVAELQEEMNVLNSYHNTLVPAASLPSEILTAIFFLCQASERHAIGSQMKETLRWVYLTHVCRRWRDAAIGCATLWSHLAFSKPEFTEVMIRRSRTAPLTVAWWRNDGEEVARALPSILQQPGRLQKVDIRIDATARCGLQVHPLLSNLVGRAPILEELSVVNAHGSLHNVIPDDLLEGGAPSLKILSVYGCAIAKWTSLPFGPALTHLSLGSFNVVDTRPQTAEFYDYLGRLPSLRSLTLREFLPAGNGSPIQTRRTTLAVLQELVIDDETDRMTDFFAATELPQANTIELYIEDGRTMPAVEHLITALKTSWPAGGEVGVTHLFISDSEDPGPTFTFAIGPHSKLNILLTDLAPHFVEGFLYVFYDELGFESLETLVIHGFVEFKNLGFLSWRRLGRLEKLKKIHFDSSAVIGFTVIFGCEPSVDEGSPGHGRFPALSEISFDRVNFDPLEQSQREERQPMSVEHLIKGLTWRQRVESESQISKLSVTRCSHFLAQDFSHIQEVAPGLEFHWDKLEDTTGWERICSYPDD